MLKMTNLRSESLSGRLSSILFSRDTKVIGSFE